MANVVTFETKLRCTLDKLHTCMENDAISTKNLEHYATIAYRMGESPISIFQNYMKVNNVIVTVKYLETCVWDAKTMDFIRCSVSNKTTSTLLVVALKTNNFCKKVKVYYISGISNIKESSYPRLKCLV